MMKLRNKFLFVFFILALTFCFAFICSAKSVIFCPYGEYVFNSDSSVNVDFVYDNDPNHEVLYVYNGNSLQNIFIIEDYESFYQFFKKLDFNAACDFFTNNGYDYSGLYYNYFSYGVGSEEKYNSLLALGNSLSASSGATDAELEFKYNEGVTDGIKQAHEFTSDWLSDNGILYEPYNSNGDFESLGNLLGDNYAYSIDTVRINTLNHSINVLENWLKSKDLEIKDYINDGSVNAIDNLVAANFDSAYADWVKEGRKDSISRLSQWLLDNDLKYSSFENSGLLSDIDNGLNLNVLPALDARQAQGYSNGQAAGVLDGKTQMYNELMGYINTSFGTEYPTSDGTSYDFTVPSQAYTVAYEAGELYQLNKFTDDGGISDFLADISGTILSTFFYLGTNISFMGTTALSLISLFVIAAMVIFALKFFKY